MDDDADVCGFTRVTFGTVWVCDIPPHDTDDEDQVRRPGQSGYYPRSEQHHFVNEKSRHHPDPWAGTPTPERKPLDLSDDPPF